MKVMSEKKKIYSYLTPVKEVPHSKKEKESAYDLIIKEFLDSGLKNAMVNRIENKKPASISQSIYKRIKANDYPIKLKVRGNEIYLVKVEKP